MSANKIAILLPCFNEAASIARFNEILLEKINSLPFQFDIIYINDGSTDTSAEIISQFKSQISYEIFGQLLFEWY